MKCIAFVIGIDNYDNHPKLHSAIKDAHDIADALKALKFEVELHTDCPYMEAHTAVYAFEDKFTDNPDVAVFFFAGHGQMINGTDCLLMKDAPIPDRAEDNKPKAFCLNLEDVMRRFNAAGNQKNIFIIDACRVVPNVRGVSSYEFGKRVGIVPYQTFISFSTAPGAPAKDGLVGKNSPFVTALLAHIMEEDLDVEILFKKVRNDVKSMGYDQYPWEHTCLLDRFCFNHGQLSKYYDAPYEKEAYVRSGIESNPDAAGGEIVFRLMADSAYDHSKAILSLFDDKDQLDDTRRFLIGRLIYASAVNGDETCLKFLNASMVRRFQTGDKNHLLRGIYYEIYFDENDVFRERPLGDVNLLSTIESLRISINDKDAENYVLGEIAGKTNSAGYMLGKTPDYKVKIKMSHSELYDYEWREILEVTDIRYDNKSIMSQILVRRENLMMNWNQLRKELADEFAIPLQKIQTSSEIAKNDEWCHVVLADGLPEIEPILKEICLNETPSEVDALSSLSYIEEIESASVSFVEQIEDDYFIKGDLTVSVHLEYDGEDAGSMSFPGTFSIYISKSNESDEWILSSRRSHISVDTTDFYK